MRRRRSYETWGRDKARHGHPHWQEPEEDDSVASIRREETVPSKSSSASEEYRSSCQRSPPVPRPRQSRSYSERNRPDQQRDGEVHEGFRDEPDLPERLRGLGRCVRGSPEGQCGREEHIRRVCRQRQYEPETSESLPAMLLSGMTSSATVAKRSASKKSASIWTYAPARIVDR
jgi:hypothetical protein